MTRPALASAIAIAILLAGAPTVRADDPALDRAAGLLAELRYDEARAELEAALTRGTAGPDELATLYQLLGEIAAATGDDAQARAQFATALALDPDAALDSSVSPKISEPFEAARAELAQSEPLAAHAEVDAATVSVVVDGDPTGIVGGARARFRSAGSQSEIVEPGVGPFTLELPADATAIEVELVDEHGNAVANLASIDVITPVAVTSHTGGTTRSTPFLLRWQLWGGIAVGFAAAGGVAGFSAGSKADEAESLADGSAYSAARDLERAAESRARYANIAFATAGACAVAAAVLYWRSRDDDSDESERRTTLIPQLGSDHVGVAAELHF